MIRIMDIDVNPITKVGEVAGVCYNSKGGYKTGLHCLKSGHGRVLEYADLTIEISQYSIRMMRELYTHIIGTSRVQESTRYVVMDNFGYYVPHDILVNDEAFAIYENTMESIKEGYSNLLSLGIHKEDCANLLPLASHSKMVLKINLRALLHLFEERACFRALEEFRDFIKELKKELSTVSEEWAYICKNYGVPKCVIHGYCTEGSHCKEKIRPKKDEVLGGN